MNPKKSRIENVFEIINLDANDLKSKQLKISNFKRNYNKAFENLQAENRCMTTDIVMNETDIMELYLAEDNAIEA